MSLTYSYGSITEFILKFFGLLVQEIKPKRDGSYKNENIDGTFSSSPPYKDFLVVYTLFNV